MTEAKQYRIDKRYNQKCTEVEGTCIWVSRLAALADIKEAECRAVVAENDRDAMTRERDEARRERDTLERSLESVKRERDNVTYLRESDYDHLRRMTAERDRLAKQNTDLEATVARLRSLADTRAVSVAHDWLAPDLRAAGEALARVRRRIADLKRFYATENDAYALGMKSGLDQITAALADTEQGAPAQPDTDTDTAERMAKAEKAVEKIREYASGVANTSGLGDFEGGLRWVGRRVLAIIEAATQ